MAHAYTPGLRVTKYTELLKQRRLPIKGEVLVEVGDVVERDQVVARTELPGNVTTVNLVNRLGINADELTQYMLKREGDQVKAGEPLAETRPLIKWFKTTVNAEIDGTVESISSVTGQVMLREAPIPVEVPAFVRGTVEEVLPGEGVVVRAAGAYVQGIFGVGGECWGTLRMLVEAPDQRLEPDLIDADCGGQILVGGGLIEFDAIERAREAGAVGVIGGGIHDRDLKKLLGYDLGVAITGAEEIGLSVIVTEGFGQIDMARKTFDILRACSGQEASISGATQIRAGVMRPEIIVANDPAAERSLTDAAAEPDPSGDSSQNPAHQAGMRPGDALRVIRAPHFGRLGRVSELIADLRQIESGAHVRVLEVEFEDGSRTLVPRANVELIEE
jgi:biotin carboxyl carrier protein